MISRLVVLFLVAGCSAGGGDDQTKAAPAPASPAAPVTPAAPADPDTEIVPAGVAPSVTGSYLVGCSYTTQRTFLKDEVAGENVTACIVLTEDNKRADVEVLSLDVVDVPGAASRTPKIVALEVAGAPWHIGVALSPEEASAAFSVTVHGRRPDGSVFDIVAQNLTFDWRQHPDFQLFLTLATSLATALDGNSTATFMQEIVKLVGVTYEQQAHYHAFISTALVPGNVGIVGANAICQKEGDGIVVDHEWFALLHTSAKPANVLFQPTTQVWNFRGDYVSGTHPNRVNDAWWGEEQHTAALRFMSDGRAVLSPIEYNAFPVFNRLVWTGFDKSGNADPAGNCKDWTSNEPTDFGGVGDGQDLVDWTMLTKRPCSRLAHLICMSELVTP